MEFKDCLISIRRSKGLSQEALAEQLGVSRQAVSKWENGDAMPDLTKLLLLADAFDVSIDDLCGRGNAEAKDENSSSTIPAETRKSHAFRGLLAGVFTILLLVGSFFLGKQVGNNVKSDNTGKVDNMVKNVSSLKNDYIAEKSKLPDTVTFSLTDLSFNGEVATCTFMPSAANKDYHYEIVVTETNLGTTSNIQAKYEGGICTANILLEKYRTYTIAATISNGEDTRSAVLAKNVTIENNGMSFFSVDE